ncbi:MAG: primosomal protein N' [Lachnospiraceae bacterium]
MKDCYANIIVDISHESVDRTFQYRVPETLEGQVCPGSAVMIPFGKGNKPVRGYVVALTQKPEWAVDKIKDITSVLTEELGPEEEAVRLAAWMKETYGSTMIMALKTVLPVKQKVANIIRKTVIRTVSVKEAEEAAEGYEKKHQTAKARLMRELCENESIPQELVTTKLHIAAPTLKALQNAGQIRIEEQREYRSSVHHIEADTVRNTLSEEQEQIVQTVLADIREGNIRHSLIHGITGSGKTEVYMGIVEGVVRMGKQAIVLIPEIALTYQTVMRFYKRFGERVSVVNSRMSKGERYDQYEKAKNGQIDVMIGPRSALFTPFPNIGVIIIDEEHETSYKSETMPKYHAREVAVQIASYHHACVVLGSATPSLEAYHMAKQGKLRLFRLTRRLTGGTLPKVDIVDMREELQNGNRSMFSERLSELMVQRLTQNEQIMLFLNRRGISGFVSCRSCGYVMKCPHCDVSLSKHRNGKLICHYCGYEQPDVSVCPSCGSKYILGFKAGTQQVEDAVKRMFPQARVLRMDADTTKKKESYDEILSTFSCGEADILIGTQMIVKGHDFPNVTLVGILAADLSLNASDYRAGERTFDLLTQAAGRAGRGDKQGEVVIQTYQPDHYSIQFAKDQDYEGFFEEEYAYREFLLYPPAAHMLAVQIQSADQETGQALAVELKKISEERFQKVSENAAGPADEKPVVIGPAAPGIAKIKDIYRFVLYYKHQKYDTLIQVKNDMEEYLERHKEWDALVSFDFDPLNT